MVHRQLSRSRRVGIEIAFDEYDERPPSPEQRLLIAIVRRAIFDFVLYRDYDPETDPDKYNIAVDAAGWLFWDGEEAVDEEGRYSFLYICSLLDLDAQKIRDGVLRMSRRDIQRISTLKDR